MFNWDLMVLIPRCWWPQVSGILWPVCYVYSPILRSPDCVYCSILTSVVGLICKQFCLFCCFMIYYEDYKILSNWRKDHFCAWVKSVGKVLIILICFVSLQYNFFAWYINGMCVCTVGWDTIMWSMQSWG